MKFHIRLSLVLAAAVLAVPGLRAQDSLSAVNAGEAFLEQLQPRDSILIADQLKYGFELDEVRAGTGLMLPDYSKGFCEGVEVVSPWVLDTVKVLEGRKKAPELMNIKGSITVTSFDEGKYSLPPIYVVRISPEGRADTLSFSPKVLDVKTMPVDTSAFEVHDIKGQVQYPVQFREVLPWLGGALLLAAVVLVAVLLARKYAGRRAGNGAGREPAHITALRKLDRFRGDTWWTPEKQKAFYSGITDALREYIVSRFGVSAMEMTTKEIFDGLKDKDIRPDLYQEAKELFERADYVKFAKYVATQGETASAVPSAVKFVTMTYQEELDTESGEAASAGDGGQRRPESGQQGKEE